jgi:Na+/H+ antiporter NhaD/arsenite permease-like protein
VLSAVVDNIPITIALIPVIAGLESSGVNIEPLWWALAFGAGLGGNATIIGSTANIVVAGHMERAGMSISSAGWMRVGLPMLFVTCTVASLLYAALYSALLA